MNLIGQSDVFLAALDRVRRIARSDATVLVEGETGTGKEAVARAIHYLGARHTHPFVPVNCGALPDSLMENELFGHLKGAFTDAKETQTGLIAHAEGGTLFLDEVEALSPKGQIVLLRFLQDGLYRPVGGREHIAGNVRIVAASNQDIEGKVERGEFRRDLYYRLAIMTVAIPPLRERGSDVLLLCGHFMISLARQYGTAEKTLDDDSVRDLLSHHWPGNVRELENTIHREFLLAEGNELCIRICTCDKSRTGSVRQVDGELPFHLGLTRAKAFLVAEFERTFITRLLTESRGNVSLAARRAGKERRAFHRLIKKYGIDRTLFNGETRGSELSVT